MSDAIAVHHGAYGRCGLLKLDKSLPTHAHLESHLLFLVDGKAGVSKIDDTSFPMDTNTVIAINPLQPHSGIYGIDGETSLVLVLYIKPEWLAEMGAADEPLCFARNAFDSTDEIKALLSKVRQLIVEPGAHDSLQPVIFQLMHTCLQQSAGYEQTHVVSERTISDHRIEKSVRLIHEYLKEDVAPEAIASEVGLSRPHFYKLFRQHVGVTPSVYQNTLKIDLAIERLTRTDLAVNTIGHELGFASPASFSRFFTANVGVPPIAYRRVATRQQEPAIAG
jgi:AraC-like DNA-binding protein